MSVRPIQDGYNVGRKKRKTDAVFQFGDKYPILRVSVKSFSKSGGYNHVERKSLSTFCREYQISVSDQEFLKTLFLRKAVAAKGKHTHLVEQDEQSRVHEIFKHLEVGATALLGRDHPQIFAIYSIERSRWHLYDIRKQVLPVIRQHTVTFTRIARNIEFGDYIVLQRKGSQAGEHSKGFPITDIRHRANDVQIKIRLRKFFNTIEPLCFFEL